MGKLQNVKKKKNIQTIHFARLILFLKNQNIYMIKKWWMSNAREQFFLINLLNGLFACFINWNWFLQR